MSTKRTTNSNGDDTPNRRKRQVKKLPSATAVEMRWPKERHPQLNFAAEAALLRQQPEWAEYMVSKLAPYDAGYRRSPQVIYTSEMFELLNFAKRVAGKSCTNDFLDYLSLPRLAGQVALLELPAIASDSAWSRHNRRVPLDVRLGAWRSLEFALRRRELDLMPPEELLRQNLDGTHIEIPYICPIVDRKKGRVVNRDRVVCWDGGTLPKSSHNPGAKGFNCIIDFTASGTALGRELIRINDSERVAAERLIREQVSPLVAPRVRSLATVGILNADGGFHRNGLRDAIREMGFVENIHETSHANGKRAASENARRIPFEGREGWYTNGHGEVVCACGRSTSPKFFDKRKSGRAIARVQAYCPVHGSFTVTSGEWARAENPKRWVYRDPSNPDQEVALHVGNGLTYNDPFAREHGTKRWAHNEGIHGILATSYKLLHHVQPFRTIAEAEIAVSIVFSSMHLRGILSREAELGLQTLAA